MSDLFMVRPFSRRAAISIRQQILSAAILIVIFTLLASVTPAAQTITGTMSGMVVDSSGAVIPGVAVTLINLHTGDVRKLDTNSEGRFVFSAVQPEAYTVRVEAPGFEKLERTNVVLSANENLALGRIELKTGKASETITVIEGGGKVETESSDLTARLTSDQISLISTKGRDITSLLRLIPGTSYIDDVEAVGEGFGTDLPNISGQRGRSTVSTVDGLNASEPSGSNKISMTTNQDAIAEVKVLRNNYAAEYGNNGGAMINIVTKSGGQSYHGGGYYFLRNEALNANSYFNNNAGLPRGMYRHNIWGVNLGGPVQIPWIFPNHNHQKLFFFYSYEKPHTITPTNPVFVTVPTALERQGNFSQSINSSGKPVIVVDPLTGAPFANNTIPQSRWNPSTAALLNVFPLPNTLRADGTNYQVQKSVDVPKWSQIIHIDFKPTDKDNISWKGQQWVSDNIGFDTSGWDHNDRSRWGINSHYLYSEDGMTFGWTHIFSPRVVNEANVGLRHDSEGFIPGDGMVDLVSRSRLNYTAPQLFPQNNKLNTIPQTASSNGGFTSVRGNPARIFWLNRWGEIGRDYILPSVSDGLSFNRGSHVYKTGIYYEHLRNEEAPGGNWQGTLDFGTVNGDTTYAYANALLGVFKQYTEDQFRPHANLGIQIAQWYVQDEWKAAPRLTLNYGLRMGYHTQLTERDGLASSFDPARWAPANAPQLWRPFCTSGMPAIGSTCANANRRALNPVTGTLSANTNLVGTFVSGSGDQLNGIIKGTDPTVPKGFRQEQAINWEPRIGFAWDLTSAGKTVLRGMGGVYHAYRPGGGTTGGNLVSNPPFQAGLTIPGTTTTTIADLANLPANPTGPSKINAVETHSQTPTIYNFSLGIQQDIGFKTVMEISYVGSQMRHLGEKRNLNSVPDAARFVDCSVVPANMCHPENRNPFSANGAISDVFLKPYRGFDDISQIEYVGTATYNALQLQLSRRYTKGFQYGVAYTYSKTLDNSKDDDTGDVFFSRPYRLFNHGPADFDQTHIFTANYIWDVPSPGGFLKHLLGNWQASGTTSLVSGKPKTLGTSGTALFVTYNGNTTTPTGGKCPAGFSLTSLTQCTAITDLTGGEVNARPNMICDPNVGASGATGNGVPYLINTSCFARAGIGDIGNMRRNSVRLPGLVTTDLAVFKNFHITEKTTLQFRWETYNLFNHSNFKDIDGNMRFNADGSQTNSRFGAAIDALPPRIMQGSLRFSF